MPYNFIITKVFPICAIVLIYWIGSYDLPNLFFLPIALLIAGLVFYVTKKYGDKTTEPEERETKEK